MFGGGQKRAEELRFASRICAESLTALAEVRAARPQLSGDELYAAVIARRLASDERKARAILDRTYASLEDWGNDREPKLLDVVTYMIVSEYLAATPGEPAASQCSISPRCAASCSLMSRGMSASVTGPTPS